ncbi:hypothetical protein ABZP36_033061 [Zizania latifolia]
MGTEALKEGEVPAEEATTPVAPEAVKDDVAEEEKAIIPEPAPPPASKSEDTEPPSDDSKAAVVFVEKVADKPHADEAAPRSSNDRGDQLMLHPIPFTYWLPMLQLKDMLHLCCRASKKLSAILSWENTKKAVIKTQLKKKEEELERKKAEYAEITKNKEAIIHKEAEEKRAMVLARRGEDMIKAEEMAAKYRATGVAPKKHLSCFGA